MRGMHNQTGKALNHLSHLKQSLRDILTTPIGSRVMRRDYGSRIYDLVDAPMNRWLVMQLFAATVSALDKWEPRFQLTRVVAEKTQEGQLELYLEGKYLPDGSEIKMEGILL